MFKNTCSASRVMSPATGQRAKSVSCVHGDPIPAEHQKDEQRNDDHRADKAQLLAGDGENIVVMLLRQIQIFLAALAEAQARQAAGADGIAGLNDLVALIRGVPFRVEPGGDPVGGVALGGKIHHQQQRNKNAAQDQPFLSVPPRYIMITPTPRMIIVAERCGSRYSSNATRP